jgi:hypothetical protein
MKPGGAEVAGALGNRTTELPTKTFFARRGPGTAEHGHMPLPVAVVVAALGAAVAAASAVTDR